MSLDIHRLSPVLLADEYPISKENVCGKRAQDVIPKENNFEQPGALYRSWPADRQERFADRITKNFLLQPRVTQALQR